MTIRSIRPLLGAALAVCCLGAAAQPAVDVKARLK